jgi:hypothetical protein
LNIVFLFVDELLPVNVYSDKLVSKSKSRSNLKSIFYTIGPVANDPNSISLNVSIWVNVVVYYSVLNVLNIDGI